MKKSKARLLAGLLLSATAASTVPAEDAPGIYADFDTSLGSFTCILHYEESPRAVANFIGLAEGSRPWIDPATGAIRSEPFYDGLTFHRVIDDFMNQSGSRSGLGNDGPGYSFRDELDNGLAHDAPGILSMANSGPNTNGSQFFVTADETPWLDGKHTVFGSVVEGMDVVEDINQVPTDANDRPIEPIIIHSITIRRSGPDAQAFDIHNQGLPICRPVAGKLDVIRNQHAILHANDAIPNPSVFRAWRSTDLVGWQPVVSRYFDANDPSFSSIQIDHASAPKAFFHFSTVEYSTTYAPSSLTNRTLTVSWDNGNQTLSYQFAADGIGGETTYIAYGETTEALFQVFDSSAEPFLLAWIFEHDSYLPPLQIRCHFRSQKDSIWEGKASIFQYTGIDSNGDPVWSPVNAPNQEATFTLSR